MTEGNVVSPPEKGLKAARADESWLRLGFLGFGALEHLGL